MVQRLNSTPGATPPFSGQNSPAMVAFAQNNTSMVGVLGLASAMSIGSNWVDVRRGALTPGQAVVNGLAKGVAATLIIQITSRSTPLQIALAASVLAGTGYLIDATMKKSKDELCQVGEQGKK